MLRFAVLGHPVAHSLSPAMHAFACEHVYAAYAEWIAENADG